MSSQVDAKSKMLNVRLSNHEIIVIIKTNIINMLSKRGLIKEENKASLLSKLIKDTNENFEYTVALDKPIVRNDEKTFNKVVVKFLFKHFKNFSVNYPLHKFISSSGSKGEHSIVVVSKISKKTILTIYSEYQETEVFAEHELLINLGEHSLVPEHKQVTQKEENELLFVSKNDDGEIVRRIIKSELPKIHLLDPASKYYNLQLGSICKTLRPSRNTGKNMSYRLVIKDPL